MPRVPGSFSCVYGAQTIRITGQFHINFRPRSGTSTRGLPPILEPVFVNVITRLSAVPTLTRRFARILLRNRGAETARRLYPFSSLSNGLMDCRELAHDMGVACCEGALSPEINLAIELSGNIQHGE